MLTLDPMRGKILGGIILALVVGFLLGWSFHPAPVSAPAVNIAASQPSAAGESAAKTVSMMLDFGDGTVRTFPNVELSGAQNVFAATKALSESGNGFVFKSQPPGQYGIMIDQIGNRKNGEGGAYWLFWVNNAMAEQSADNTILKPGDVVEWKFIKLNMDGAKQN